MWNVGHSIYTILFFLLLDSLSIFPFIIRFITKQVHTTFINYSQHLTFNHGLVTGTVKVYHLSIPF